MKQMMWVKKNNAGEMADGDTDETVVSNESKEQVL